MLSEERLTQCLEVALAAANKAGALIKECIDLRASKPLEIEEKSSSADMVTQYDKKCEDIVLEMLRAFDPSFEILSEESNPDTPFTANPTWIVDPIDGTTSFVHGSFDCGVSIGLAVGKEPVLGVVVLPLMQEVFTAVKGRGSFCNGRRIHVSNCTDLKRAIVCTHTMYRRTPEAIEALLNINRELLSVPVHAVRSYGSAAMDMCSVAMGRIDLYFEVGIQAWDMCAATIIVREAGGHVRNSDDVANAVPLDITSKGMCCAANPALADFAAALVVKHNYRNAILN